MRIWDVNPGYLNRQSLLGEHRELHGILSIIRNDKKGYSNHPETKRWVNHGWALRQRHELLACEMALRGYTDKSPVTLNSNTGLWPKTFIDDPARQFRLLNEKYVNKEAGRIPLPENERQLWDHHRYSVLARDPDLFEEIERNISKMNIDFSELALYLTQIMRRPPAVDGLTDVVQQLWSSVSDKPVTNKKVVHSGSVRRLLHDIQHKALQSGSVHITTSTALSELMAWSADTQSA